MNLSIIISKILSKNLDLIFLTNLPHITAYQTKQACLQSYHCLAVVMKYGCRFLYLNAIIIIKQYRLVAAKYSGNIYLVYFKQINADSRSFF